MLAAVTLVSAVALAPRMASAEGIFDFFFGGFQKQQRQGSGQANFFADPVDLTLDTSLRPGDVIATTDGLVAYSGVRIGASQTAEFTPIASYPGLAAETRARLGEMKVAPVAADMLANETPPPEASRDVAPPATSVPKTVSTRAKRAEVE